MTDQKSRDDVFISKIDGRLFHSMEVGIGARVHYSCGGGDKI